MAAATPPKPTPPAGGNPAFRMAGLPSRFKLPSRNWMIFLSLVGTLAGTITYDRRERTRIQAEWCERVKFLADQTLPNDKLRRRITVVLGSFPGDGIIHTREYFHEYVKPILNAAALDWDVVEGVKEGDIRFGIAEKVRRRRRRSGEGTMDEWAPELSLAALHEAGEDLSEKEKKQVANSLVEAFRTRIGAQPEPGPGGHLVIGRHAWKEYIAGLHEGWLGPADSPIRPIPEKPLPTASIDPDDGSEPDGKPDSKPSAEKLEEEAKEKRKRERRIPLPPTILPIDYSSADLARSAPAELDPVAAVSFPHIMGFFNSHVRLYRFLTRRYQADEVGRQVAALVLAQSVKPFGESTGEDGQKAVDQIATVLEGEEQCWHKSIRKRRTESESKADSPAESTAELTTDSGDAATKPVETVWTDDVVIDDRIADRMRRFELVDSADA